MYKRCGNLKILKAKHTEYRSLAGEQAEASPNVRLLLPPLVAFGGSMINELENYQKGRLEM